MSEFPALEISHSARLTQRRVKQKLLLNISEKLSTYVDFSRKKSITHKHSVEFGRVHVGSINSKIPKNLGHYNVAL